MMPKRIRLFLGILGLLLLASAASYHRRYGLDAEGILIRVASQPDPLPKAVGPMTIRDTRACNLWNLQRLAAFADLVAPDRVALAGDPVICHDKAVSSVGCEVDEPPQFGPKLPAVPP